MGRFLGALGMAAALVVAASIANAATVEFINWSQSGSDTVIPTFTVSDDPADKFKVSVDISPSSPNGYGEITGIYFDLVPDVLVDADITGETVGGGTTHTHFATNDSKINGVTNLNLGDFDYILGYKDGNDKGQVPIMFFVSDKGGTISLADWDRVGIRWQVVGENGPGSGSDKEVSTSVVPIPGAAWLFGSGVLGLLGLAYTRRRQAAA